MQQPGPGRPVPGFQAGDEALHQPTSTGHPGKLPHVGRPIMQAVNSVTAGALRMPAPAAADPDVRLKRRCINIRPVRGPQGWMAVTTTAQGVVITALLPADLGG
jgi:hypothetical protein